MKAGLSVFDLAKGLPLDQPHAFQLEQHLMGAVVDVDIFCLDAQFGVGGNVIGV